MKRAIRYGLPIKPITRMCFGSIDNIWDKERKADIPYLKTAMTELASNKKIKTSSTPPKGCGIKRITNK